MILLEAIGLMYLTWLFFLAVMNLKRAKDAGTISRVALFFGYPILFVGLLLDCLCNLTVCTLMFAELPQEGLVTARLKRLEPDSGWRGRLARWWATELLDTFDPSGVHV